MLKFLIALMGRITERLEAEASKLEQKALAKERAIEELTRQKTVHYMDAAVARTIVSNVRNFIEGK